MDKIKRFIDIFVPVTTCTLRCHYCYITHHRLFGGTLPKFQYSPEHVRKALSTERLGGKCIINICGAGETLLPPEIPHYVKELLIEGHYVMIVTNATINKAFSVFEEFEPCLLERLFFKFSLHYIELKKRNLLERFAENVNKMKELGSSFTVEVTPSDELIPYIDELKDFSLKKFGAVPHFTVARDEHCMSEIPILTHLSIDDYKKTWSQMKSEMFDFKFSTFSKKRNEFCYAGDWSFLLNLGNGEMRQCYNSPLVQYIFDDINKPIKFQAIGHNCQMPHCFNSHAFLTFGTIPELTFPTYDKMRNRICDNGSQWLSTTMKNFMCQKLVENNSEYTTSKKYYTDLYMKYLVFKRESSFFNKVRTMLSHIKHILH